MDYSSLSDREVIKLIRQGDRDAMDHMLNRYRGMVKKETRTMYLYGGEEDDLVQEGMIGLFNAIRDYDLDKDTDFALFAHICIVRRLYRAVTVANEKKHNPLNSYVSFSSPVATDSSGNRVEFADVLEDPTGSAEERALSSVSTEDLKEYLDKNLTGREKEVLDHFLAGESYEETGRKLHCSKKAVDNAIQRVRLKVRRYLAQQHEI